MEQLTRAAVEAKHFSGKVFVIGGRSFSTEELPKIKDCLKRLQFCCRVQRGDRDMFIGLPGNFQFCRAELFGILGKNVIKKRT